MPKKADKKPKVTRKQKIEAARASSSNNEKAGSSNSIANVTIERLDDPVKSDTDKNQYSEYCLYFAQKTNQSEEKHITVFVTDRGVAHHIKAMCHSLVSNKNCKVFFSATIDISSKTGGALATSENSAASSSRLSFIKITGMEKNTLERLSYLPCTCSNLSQADNIVIRLSNGLTAVLISRSSDAARQTDCNVEEDQLNFEENGAPKWYENMLKKQKAANMASVTVCINVGSFSEISQVAGESLIVPHVIFEGSKKNPRNNEFSRFISDHNGIRNSSTECERTFLTFSVPEEFIRDGIELFVNCFVNPVMSRASILNKRRDIEIDYRMELDRPVFPYGKQHVYSELMPVGHPCMKFREHYLESMCQAADEKFYKEVLSFRERHYNANRMTAVIEARLPLNTLEEYAKEHFSRMPNNDFRPVDLSMFSYDKCFCNSEFRNIFQMKHKYGMVNHKIAISTREIAEALFSVEVDFSVKKREVLTADFSNATLEITWTMPPVMASYRSKPQHYLAWILNHKGKGTLHSYLREKNMSTRVCCRVRSKEFGFQSNSVWTLFELSIDLTDEGHDDWKSVLDVVFSYVNLMRRAGPKRRIFDEIRNIAEAKFRFSTGMSLSGPCINLSSNMHIYPPAEYLTGSVLYFDYDPAAIKDCLELLLPERASFILFDNDFEETESVIEDPDDEEAQVYFERDYFSRSEIPDEWYRQWKYAEPLPEFYLPEANPFVADDFTLISIPEKCSQVPVKIFSNEILEVWHKYDTKFRLPNCYMCFCYLSPLPNQSAKNAAMMDLLRTILEQFLFDELYHADSANLNYEVKSVAGRFEIRVDGFSQKLPLLTQTITKYVAECSNLVTQEIFESGKDDQMKGYHKIFSLPDYLAEDIKLSLLRDLNWTALDKHTALLTLQIDEFQHFLNHFTDQLFVKCLVQGNMSESVAIENAKQCVQLLNCKAPTSTITQCFRVHEISKGARCCRVTKMHPPLHSSCVKNYYQFGESTIANAVMIDLLSIIVNDHAFQDFRKQEKLSAWACRAVKEDYGLLGYTLTVIDCRYYPEAHDYGELAVSWEDQTVEIFRKSLNKLLKDFSDRELLALKEILVNAKGRVREDLEEQVSNNWAEIMSGELVFGRRQQEFTTAKELEIHKLKEGLTRFTDDDSSIRKLSIQVVQETQFDENTTPSPEKENDNVELRILYPHRLRFTMYLGSNTKEDKYFITDIEEYKRQLKTPQVAVERAIEKIVDNMEKLGEA